MTEKRRASSGNYGNWDSALKHLQKYCSTDTIFNDVDVKFVEGFKKYLATLRAINHYQQIHRKAIL